MVSGRKLFALACLTVLLAVIGNAAPANAENDVAQQLETLRAEGRYPEAIAVLKRQIATMQAQGQLETPVGATLLNNLGELHYKLGRYGEAVPLYERSLAISDRLMPGVNPVSAVTYRNLGIVYQLTGRPGDAMNAYARSIGMFQQIPNSQVQLASTLNNVAGLLEDAKRYADAERVLMQVGAIYQQSFGPSHPYVATAYNNLGELYQKAGDLNRAEPMLLAANQIAGQNYSKDHPQRVSILRNLGLLYIDRKDWARAVPPLRDALAILQKQAARSSASREGELSGASIDPAMQKAVAGLFINAAMQLTMADQSQGVGLVREVFRAGQWRPSQAAASLVQMSVRRLKGDGPLPRLVRQRQDLVGEWQAIQQRTTDAAMKGVGAAGNIRMDIARLDQIDKSIQGLDDAITRQFPDYADFANPAPLDVPAIQDLLREDEALALFIETDGPGWVWVITKKDKNLSLLNMTSEALAEEVAAMRCGLDQSNWAEPDKAPADNPAAEEARQRQQRTYDRCRKLGGKLDASGLPPFDAGRAHRLWKAFFGASEAALAGKHLIIVPSANLMQFPFATLVMAPPSPDGDLRRIKWLGTTMPVSVLPSISSLGALRRVATPSKAGKPFLGVGNPLLTGNPSSGQDRQLAIEARDKQRCAGPVQVASNAPRTLRAVAHLQPASAFRGGLADIATLTVQMPLPETADELCAVAESLQAGADDVLLGAKASETVLKDIGKAGRLEQYRILHFATHGLVSGDLPGVAEPSLLLTPPATATEQDDGLLTASEIAQLKLDANWVVLSACNTAAGGSEGAEALSGLARAFFYAGARALLVTHWEINSAAAVKLTTGAFGALQHQPGLSQSEAMRQAMAALVKDESVAGSAHPSVWAAFALVGDGGRL